MYRPTVLYEDNHLLVVVKPPMMPVQADASGDEDLLNACKGYVREKYGKPGAVYLGLVHRLDRPVGGVMVFARTSKAAARLQGAMQGSWEKVYLAVVEEQGERPLPQAGRLEDWIRRDEGSHGSRVVREGEAGGKYAALRYSLRRRQEGLALVEVQLETGRHHQIRVQFAARGWPIWGDARYNPRSRPGQPIALWAHRLAFPHPTKKETLTFSVQPPREGAWEIFYRGSPPGEIS